MTEDVTAILDRRNVVFELRDVATEDEFAALLEELTERVLPNHSYPILHLDMHGDPEKGLCMVGDEGYVSWHRLVTLFRMLNVAMSNNLCVLSSVCFSLNTIKPLELMAPTPFLALMAPERVVQTGFLEDNIARFYDELFESKCIDMAFEVALSTNFHFFHCEQLLFNALKPYITAGCRGRSGRERREQLISEVMSSGIPRTADNLKIVRSVMKFGIAPSAALLRRYADTFLIGRECSFSIEDLMRDDSELGP